MRAKARVAAPSTCARRSSAVIRGTGSTAADGFGAVPAPVPVVPELSPGLSAGRTRGRKRRAPLWLVLVATSLPMFMATLDNLVITCALPVIRADLGATVDNLAWFVNAYTLAFATFMLPAATLGDRWGRRE